MKTISKQRRGEKAASPGFRPAGRMVKDNSNTPLRPVEKQALKKKIHRALVEARNAIHRGDEEAARAIVKQIMEEAAPFAYEAGKEGGFNWVVEALKPLDELMLPDDDSRDR